MSSFLNPVHSPLESLLANDVQLAAGGDKDAFARLVSATSSTVCAIAFAIVRDPSTSEDVAQDVYLAAWKGLGKLQNPMSFLPWLRQITRNCANGQLRKVVARRMTDPLDEQDLAQVIDSGPRPDVAYEQRQDLQLVAEALESIPTESREVLVLYYREGRSTAQVADLLGLSEAAVRKRLSRARGQIRQDLAERLRLGLERSAPGAALVTSILASVAVSSAPANAAVAGGLALRGATVGGWKLAGAAGGFTGVVAGIAGGVAGVMIGLRGDFADAIDDLERRQLVRFRRTAISGTVVAGLALAAVAMFGRHWLGPTLVYLSFLTFLGVLYFGWLPRIVARRLARELRADSSAAQRHRLRRIYAFVGMVAGAIGGGIGLVVGLGLSGLLPF